MHYYHRIALSALLLVACTAPLCAQTQEDVKAQEFAEWQQKHGAEEDRKAAQWHADFQQRRANPPAPSIIPAPNTAAAEFLTDFARAWRSTYRVSCTTRTTGVRGVYRTTTSCY